MLFTFCQPVGKVKFLKAPNYQIVFIVKSKLLLGDRGGKKKKKNDALRPQIPFCSNCTSEIVTYGYKAKCPSAACNCSRIKRCPL